MAAQLLLTGARHIVASNLHGLAPISQLNSPVLEPVSNMLFG